MNILITGNLGYVGSELSKYLKKHAPEYNLIGFDNGYFANCLAIPRDNLKSSIDMQYFGDIRSIDDKFLENVDAVVNLSAISNDPMGEKFAEVTETINYKSSIRLAKLAYEKGIKSFIFASSCSIYGNGTNSSRTEDCHLNPLTEYARSKVNTENDLQTLADVNYTITNLRFSTACGMSDRFRMDLVLNDFVTSATVNKKIEILSDGSPWRPLIDVKDMARAIHWAIQRDKSCGGEFLSVNVGKNSNNFQIKDLATSVKDQLNEVEVSINTEAEPDKRSYRVNFDLFNELAPEHAPIITLEQSVEEILSGLNKIEFSNKNFRDSNFIRLKKLTSLQEQNKLNNQLQWIN